jgi:2-polyprenyl-3-methyl-5-hydroxy-6-metoxy-1,4-benzoquinol methylase
LRPSQLLGGLFNLRRENTLRQNITLGLADLTISIEDIELPDAAFDVVLCSHVLEHVNDRKALMESFRILKPGGIALLMTPVVEDGPRLLKIRLRSVTPRDGYIMGKATTFARS